MIVASISTFACKLGDMSIKSDLDNSFACEFFLLVENHVETMTFLKSCLIVVVTYGKTCSLE